MATEVLMPQMGESIAEGTITRWLVAEGDTVEREQVIFEVATDKVDAEIPSPAAGKLLKILHVVDDVVEVGKVVALIGEEGEAVGDAPSAGSDAANVEPAAAAAASPSAEEPAVEAGGEQSLEERVARRSSPVVRKIIAERGLDLNTVLGAVEGTGIHGRVTKADLLSFLDGGGAERLSAAPVAASGTAASAPATPAAAAPAPSARPAGDFHVAAYQPGENVVIEPMSRIRQLTSAHMTYSKATSAHVTTVFEVDLTRVAALRQRVKGAFQRANGTKLTFMPFIFQAVAGALKAYPELNAAVDGKNIVFKKDINLGMAVAFDRGLIVPVIRHADRLSITGLAQTANDLADRARSKRLDPGDVQGGTFTITNPGVFGSLFGTPIINQPQVAILGIGTIEKRPAVVTGPDGLDALAIRQRCYFALTFDHRIVDGEKADYFMMQIKESLQSSSWDELESLGS
ncbi:MAG: dihydrolipoamide acetyltransferase family protein [Acidobacteriota bacterium]